jgi:hypothetical protein
MPRQSAWCLLAIAAVLVALAPFIPATIALALTIALGLHAIFTAIVRVRDVLAAA